MLEASALKVIRGYDMYKMYIQGCRKDSLSSADRGIIARRLKKNPPRKKSRKEGLQAIFPHPNARAMLSEPKEKHHLVCTSSLYQRDGCCL